MGAGDGPAPSTELRVTHYAGLSLEDRAPNGPWSPRSESKERQATDVAHAWTFIVHWGSRRRVPLPGRQGSSECTARPHGEQKSFKHKHRRPSTQL